MTCLLTNMDKLLCLYTIIINKTKVHSWALKTIFPYASTYQIPGNHTFHWICVALLKEKSKVARRCFINGISKLLSSVLNCSETEKMWA